MRISLPGKQTDAIVQSTVPLVAQTDSGAVAPVDTTLVGASNGGWKAVNVPAKTTIGQTLGDGSALGEGASRLFVRPGGRNAVAGNRVDNKVFFANSDLDTDTIVEPTPNGASVAWTLRSPAAAEAQSLHFDMPAGVSLRSQGPELVFVKDGRSVGSVAAPHAFDAQGTVLPASYELNGPRDVTVNVAHRTRDVAYPIGIDPYIYWNYHNTDDVLIDDAPSWALWASNGEWVKTSGYGSPARTNEV